MEIEVADLPWVANTVPEIIDSGPMCITDLSQNEFLAILAQNIILSRFKKKSHLYAM